MGALGPGVDERPRERARKSCVGIQTKVARSPCGPFQLLNGPRRPSGGIAMDSSRRETIESTGVGRMHSDQLPLKVRRQFRNLKSMTMDRATQFIRVCFRRRSLFQVNKAGNPAGYLHALVSEARRPGAYVVQRIKWRSFAGELSQE